MVDNKLSFIVLWYEKKQHIISVCVIYFSVTYLFFQENSYIGKNAHFQGYLRQPDFKWPFCCGGDGIQLSTALEQYGHYYN